MRITCCRLSAPGHAGRWPAAQTARVLAACPDIRLGYPLPMSSETVVFQVGNSLAVRLIGDCKLPRGMRVRETRDGDRIILEPLTDKWSPAFLAAAGSWDEDLPRPGVGEPARDPFA